MPVEIPGIILAGGLARRMGGGDKSLHTLGGRPVLDRVIERLRPQAAPILLNANGDPGRFADFGLPVLPDPLPDYPGPLAGVLAGLDWAAGAGAAAIVTVAADTPFFPADLVARLSATATGARARIALAATPRPAGEGYARHPTFGYWSVDLRDDLRAALGDGVRKIVAWTDRHDAVLAVFAPTRHDPFFNINTPQDMLCAEILLRTDE